MRATDIPLLDTVSRPTLSPDGDRVIAAVGHADLDADAYVGQLWTAPTDGSTPPRRFTRGFRDSDPQFSPDGSLVAFLRATPDGPSQLHVVDARGGEPLQATDEKLGVTEFAWSPDGMHLAFVTRVPEPGRYGTVEQVGADAEPARRITTLRYQANGVGYTNDRRSSVFVLPTPDVSAEPAVKRIPVTPGETPGEDPTALGIVPATRLTADDADYSRVRFRADGRSMLAIAARHDTRDTDLRTGVYEIPVDGGAVRTVVGPEHDLAISDIAPGPDGSLHLLAQELGATGRDFVARNTALYTVAANGRPERRTDPETVDLGEVGSGITVDADGVLVQNRVRGTVQLLRVGVDGELTTVVDGPLEVTGVAAASGIVAVAVTNARGAGEIAVVRGGILSPVSDFSAAVRNSGLVAPRELVLTGRDGYPVHGWVFTPDGDGPHPVLLVIHGGPFAAYSVALFDEAQVYADAGYAVVLCNPRGSAGYGQAHGRAIRQRMGTVDLTDVLDFLDGALADPRLDAERVGIMGGSYGGYLTAWAIAHEHRFAAAIIERGFLDPDGFVGTSDIGSFFGDEYVGTEPELMRAQSPQAVVDRVRTPALVLHSANDLRCPLGQAERYYAALKRGGVLAELVIFPGENHELSRSGRPRHRVERFDVILEWWSRFLPTERHARANDDRRSREMAL